MHGTQWGGHIGSTLDIGGAGVVGYGIGGTVIYHGRGKLGRMRLHKLARIAMMFSIAEWPPVSGHPAMEVAIIEVQFRRARQRGTGRLVLVCLRRCLAFIVFLIAFLSVVFLV
jgi:hypothetical protein